MVIKADKTIAQALVGVPVLHHHRTHDVAMLDEHVAQVIIHHVLTKILDIEISEASVVAHVLEPLLTGNKGAHKPKTTSTHSDLTPIQGSINTHA